MSSLSAAGLRSDVIFLCGALMLTCPAPVAADPKPLTKEEQAKIDEAIDKGVAFLKKAQTKEGDFDWKMKPQSHFVGQCALPAYALLESGVPADDPAIQSAADYLRPRALITDWTYELSLALLFFDRLNDPKDKKMVQTLALRLIAGQHRSGGWGYHCPELSEDNEQQMLKYLGVLSKGFAALSRAIEKPTGQMQRPVEYQDLYFLWSLERVGMLYNMQDICGKDWYRWGAEILVTNQSKRGGWTKAVHEELSNGRMNYRPTLSTAFALLFLKRSHPMKDLTPKLPFTAKELNQGIARLRPRDRFPMHPVSDSPTVTPSRGQR